MAKARWEKWGGLAGILFIGLFIAGTVVGVGSRPGGDSSSQEIADFYASQSNRTEVVIGILLTGLAGFFLIFFLGSLRDRLRRVEGVAESLASLSFAGGIAFIVLLWVGSTAGGVIAASWEFGDYFSAEGLDPQLVRLFSNLYFWLMVHAAVAAAACVVTVSIIGAKSAEFPRWLAWIGYGVSVLLLLSEPLFLMPIALFLFWVLAISVLLLITEPLGESRDFAPGA